MLSRSITTASLSGRTRSTLPVFPLSLPPITMTLSFLRICTRSSLNPRLQYFRCERNYLHKFLGPELARHRTENTCADRFRLIIDQHCGVIIEANIRAIRPAKFFGGAHHHRLHDVALFDLAIGNRFFHRNHDNVADGGVFAFAPAEHLDTLYATRAGVIGNIQSCSHLNHESTSAPQLSARRLGRLLHRLRSFKYLADAPPFISAERPAFYDQHAIADAALIGFVVRLDVGTPAQDLLVLRVGHRPFYGNHHGFLHPVTDDDTGAFFS